MRSCALVRVLLVIVLTATTTLFAFATGTPQVNIADDPNCVNPDSAVAGSEFTFTVECYGAEPTTTELWIDVNGDGIYSDTREWQRDATLNGLAPFAQSPRLPGPTMALLLAFAVGLAAILTTGRRSRSRATMKRFLIACIVFAAATSCQLFPGSWVTTTEIYTLERQSSEPADWSGSEILTQTVVVAGPPRTVNFRFYVDVVTEEGEAVEAANGTAAGVVFSFDVLE